MTDDALLIGGLLHFLATYFTTMQRHCGRPIAAADPSMDLTTAKMVHRSFQSARDALQAKANTAVDKLLSPALSRDASPLNKIMRSASTHQSAPGSSIETAAESADFPRPATGNPSPIREGMAAIDCALGFARCAIRQREACTPTG